MPILTFPKNFVWGCAASAYQIEGAWNEDGRGPSIWDTFCHTPGKIANGETGDVSIDHYHRYKEDVELMAELGLNAYRFSVSWSRVLPKGAGAVNKRGLDFYDRLVDELLTHKIEPYVCLYHFDLPQALEDKGGWPERQTAYHFANYACIIAERLGDRVTRWITHNEPFAHAIGGYFFGESAPGIQNPIAAIQAAHHILLSHGLAAEAIRTATKKPAKIGIVLDMHPVHAATNRDEDRAAAARIDAVHNKAVLEPLLRARMPDELLALFTPVYETLIQPDDLDKIAALDLLGINYYTRFVVCHDPDFPVVQANFVQPEGNEYSMMWEIYPEGLYELLMRIWREYCKPSPPAPLPSMGEGSRPSPPAPSRSTPAGLPKSGEGEKMPGIMVTENGVPVPDGVDFDGRVRDERRIRYLRNHITQVHRAIQDGVPVKGYFVWSFMDNFEWALGYGPRFGLVYVDYKTQKRIVKDSGHWYAGVINANEIDF